MGIPTFQFQQMQERLSRNAKREPLTDAPAVEREIPLHHEIMRYCDGKFPKWKYIRARSDKRSTIGNGICDFTVFLPDGRVLCFECKATGQKRTPEQMAWAVEMKMLGHEVWLVQSMSDFVSILPKDLQ